MNNLIGNSIRTGLLRKDISQKKLSEIMGVSPPTINKWVSGENKPEADKLISLIKILQIQDLFFSEVESQSNKKIATLKDIESLRKELKDEISKGEEIFSTLVKIVKEEAIKESRIIALEKEIQELKQILKVVNPAQES